MMGQLVKLYRESHLGKRLPAYDGRKSLYTAGPLPFATKEFRITLADEDDGSGAPRFFLMDFLLLFPLVWMRFCISFLTIIFNFLDAGERENSKL